MGRFLDRFNKHPERGAEYLDQASRYKASQVLGRGFGETTDDYIKRNPSAAKAFKEANDDIVAIQKKMR